MNSKIFNETKSTPKDKQFILYQNAKEVLEEHVKTKNRLVIYRNEVFNIGEYLNQLGHPGGEKVLREFYGRDITKPMHQLKHSKTAYKMLQNYKIGEIIEKMDYNSDYPLQNDNHVLHGHSLISKKMADKIANRFDLNKPIYPQIIDKTVTLSEYLAFIREPKIFDDPKKQIRIFNEDFLELFSSTPWYAVPLFWIPLGLIVLYIHCQLVQNHSVTRAVMYVVLGFFQWSATEYSLHRFIFHQEKRLPENPTLFGVHFLIHGIHHAFPQDPGRLVFPVLNAAIVGFFISLIYFAFMSYDDSIFALIGFLIGYICYDLFHYFLHHSKSGFLNGIKIYHQKHHHKDPEMVLE